MSEKLSINPDDVLAALDLIDESFNVDVIRVLTSKAFDSNLENLNPREYCSVKLHNGNAMSFLVSYDMRGCFSGFVSSLKVDDGSVTLERDFDTNKGVNEKFISFIQESLNLFSPIIS